MKKGISTAWIVLLLFMGGLHAQNKDSLTFVNAKWDIRQLADGVEWRQYHFKDKEQLLGANQYINLIVVDQQNAKVRFTFAAKEGEKVRTSDAAKSAGALAAINGSFYNTKRPYNSICYLKIDGKVIMPKGEFSNFMIVDQDGRLKIEKTDVSKREEPTILGSYGPMLILDGKAMDRNLGEDRNPCTAIGTQGDKVFLLVVDGRSRNAAGMTHRELIPVFQWLGADNALNLDGGGSSTMYIKGQPDNGVVNHPSDNFFGFSHSGERSVSNSILLLENNTAALK